MQIKIRWEADEGGNEKRRLKKIHLIRETVPVVVVLHSNSGITLKTETEMGRVS